MVKDLLTPLIGAVGKIPDFSGIFFTINDSKFMIGEFVNAAVSFVIIAAAVYFFVVLPVNTLIAKTKKEGPTDPTTKACPECLSTIPLNAKRCAHCTSSVV